MSGTRKLSQAFVVVLAGAGAFYAASLWSRQRTSGDRVDGDDIVVAVSRPAAGAALPATAMASGSDPREAASAPSDRRIPSAGGQAFSPLSWLPPPPPPPPPPPAAAPAPPPAPVLPALPFVFVGLVERGAEHPEAYLAKGDALLVVAVGDLIENNTYRVDALAPSGVVLTYLPMGKQQTVNAPGATR